MNIIGYRDTIGTVIDTPQYSALVNTAGAVGQRAINIGAIWECTTPIPSAPSTFNTRDWKMFGYYTGTGTIGSPTGNGCRDGLVGEGVDVTHPKSPERYDVMGRFNTPFIIESIARNTRVPVLALAGT
ncbi:hypothetical protein [Gordonia amicalis]|uniref:hypothetical protein n=1 Tax=Gordonia amicalis TaxID=89053 RepID=UPI0015F38009|nr:hypothetical protein [Gordonia amicalis]MBA5846172.1 hypothetical protein [Gordonia amicalis]